MEGEKEFKEKAHPIFFILLLFRLLHQNVKKHLKKDHKWSKPHLHNHHILFNHTIALCDQQTEN